MRIRITGKQLPKHQGLTGPSQVMGNSMTFPQLQPFDFQKGMGRITGKFKVNQPTFGYTPIGLTRPENIPPVERISMPGFDQSVDDDITQRFNAENPVEQPAVPTPGQAAMNAGIGPQMRPEDIEAQQWYNASRGNQHTYDKGLYDYHMQYRKGPDSKAYRKWYKSKYPEEDSSLAEKIGNANLIFKGALSGLNQVTNFFDTRRREDEFKRNRIYDNLNPQPQIPMSGSRGDYNINDGMFRPDDMQPPNKGQYTNPYYGATRMAEYGGIIENEPTMKIRITGRNMEYGGQSGYGLDLNQRRIYSDMPDDPEDNVSSTITENDDPNKVLEAEKREYLIRPDKSTATFGGKYHSQGGVKTTAEQTPEGSYIYSRVLKEKRPEVLEALGVKKKGMSYADMARPYNNNKYLATLANKHADKLKKSTAQMMVDKNTDRLGLIALAQESFKGFPDGIPDVSKSILPENVAAYGGFVPKFQTAGQYNIYESDFEKALFDLQQQNPDLHFTISPRMMPGTNRDNMAPNIQRKSRVGTYGDVAGKDVDEFAARHQWYFKDNPNWDPRKEKDVRDFQARYNERFRTAFGKDYFSDKRRISRLDGKFGEYTYNAPGFDNAPSTTQETVENKYMCTPQGVVSIGPNHPANRTPGAYAGKVFNSYEEAFASCSNKVETKKEVKVPNEVTTVSNQQPPFKYMYPDLRRMITARMRPPEFILPYYADINAVVPNPTFEDWRSKAAGRQAMYNTAAQTMGAYGPGQGLASNLSFLAGQQGDQLIQDIAQTETRNVGVANPFAIAQAEVMNKMNEYNTANKTNRYAGWEDRRKKFIGDKRKQDQIIDAADIAGWKNRSKLSMINMTNPYYYMDPFSGRTVFKGGKSIDDIMNNWSTGVQNNMATGLEKYPEYYNQAIGKGLTDDLAKRWAYTMATAGMSGRSRSPMMMMQQQPGNYGGVFSGYTGYTDAQDDYYGEY